FPYKTLFRSLGINEAVIISLPPGFITHDLIADFIKADTLGPFINALQIMALLPVHLHQSDDMFQCLILCLDLSQNLGALNIKPGSTGKMKLETAIDTDDANILAGCFGTITGAAGNRHFDLGRGP